MAKARIPNSRRENLEHKKRVERYSVMIQQVYDKVAREASFITSLSDPSTDKPFSFSDYPMAKEAIKRLQSQLMSEVGAIIMSGTSEEWKESNLVQDLVAKKVLTAYTGTTKFGEEYSKYFQTNHDALQAFQHRKDDGMNLSTRVWKLSEDFKPELEDAITAAIAPGISAMELAAEVKKYLKEPDKRFRRIKEKMEDGTIKWHLSNPAKSYHPGQGIYRSSARNAQRLARTEINMAYRTAEQKRWQQFDFVVGYEVKTTQNGHHVEDICDQLAGKYPKDFVFKGWHPQCMCYTIPILKTEEEFWSIDNTKSVNKISKVPENFSEWIRDNEERIEAAERRRKLPYFIRDNKDKVDYILYPERRKKTALEIATERHSTRTPEDVEKIRSDWSNRKVNQLWDAINNSLLPSDCASKIEEMKEDILFGDFDIFNKKAKVLDTAIKRHSQRTPSDVQNIQDRWDAKKKRDEQTKTVAVNVLKVAQSWSEVDYSNLEQMIAYNNLTAMKQETKKLAQAINAMKAEEKALSDVIPDVHKWHDTFSLSEIKQVYNAVNKTIAGLDKSDLYKLKSKLEYEADWVLNKTSYATKNIAFSAYQKQIHIVEERIWWGEKSTEANNLLSKVSTINPKIGSKWKGEIEWAVKNGKKSYLSTCITKLEKWDNILNLESSLLSSGTVDIKALQKYIKEGKINKAWDEYEKLKSATHSIENTLPQSGHYGSMSYNDALEKIKLETKCTDAKAEDYYNAVHGFSWQWDYEIRQVQCGNGATLVSRHGHSLADIEKRSRDLEEFITQSPKWDGGLTYRGMSLSPLEVDNLRAELKSGIFDNLGSASWSSEKYVSDGFARAHLNKPSPKYGDLKTERVVLILEKQKWATSIQHISNFPGECEVLASMKCRYGYIKEEKIGNILYITIKAM